MEVTLVCLKYPCSACLIVQNLMREILPKVCTPRGITHKEIVLDDPRLIYTVEGAEVEKFPMLLLDGEQVTAGNLLHARQLAAMLEERWPTH